MPPRPDPSPAHESLSEREALVLRFVVRQFIETAAPVGSRALSEGPMADVSSATIRNAMKALEARGFLGHPHTSAGRVPTDLGYRAYVDGLMQPERLRAAERALIQAELERVAGDVERLLREGSRLLGELTRLLGVVLPPRLAAGTLDRLDLVPLSSSRVLFVLAVRGGLARTIIVELEAEVRPDDLDRVVALLNERLAGLTLDEIRRTAAERTRDLDDRTGVVRLVAGDAERFFGEGGAPRRAAVGGAAHIAAQPEFQDPEGVRHVIELIGDDAVVVHLLEGAPGEAAPEPGRAAVRIPGPQPYALVTARYRLGEAVGTLGVIGPKRMDYARAVALVEELAGQLGRGDVA